MSLLNRARYGLSVLQERTDALASNVRELTKNRLDSGMNIFTNTFSGLGSSKDHATHTEVVYRPEMPYQNLHVLYTYNALAAKVVELIPEHCIREGWSVTGSQQGGKEKEDLFTYDMNRLNLLEKIKDAHIAARLYGGAGIIMGINDGRPLSQPVNYFNIHEVEALVVADRWSLQPNYVSSGGYAGTKTITYTYNPINAGSTQTEEIHELQRAGGEIHASRVIPFYSRKLSDRVAQEFYGWAPSLLDTLYMELVQFEDTKSSMHSHVHDLRTSIFKMPNLYDIHSRPGGFQQLLQRMNIIDSHKSRFNSVMLGPGEEFINLQNSLNGLGEVYDRLAIAFAGATGFPLTLLFGTAPPGLSTDDKSGTRNFYNDLKRIQTIVYAPAIEEILTYVLLSRLGPVANGHTYNVEAVPNPLEQMTKQEMTDLNYKKVLTVKEPYDRGVITRMEFRNYLRSEGIMTLTEEGDIEPLPEPEEDTLKIDDKYSAIDFTPPKRVQENAQRALVVREEKPESQRGMTEVGIARARDLSNGKSISPETVRRMLAYFQRHESDKSGSTWEEQGKGWQAWMGWGGDEGYAWAKRIVTKMEALDAE